MMDNTMNAYMDAQAQDVSGVGNSAPDGFNGVYGENMSAQGVSEKPYTFRRLKSRDVFPMVRLIRKIGVSKDEISRLIDGDMMTAIKDRTQGKSGAENQIDEINRDLGVSPDADDTQGKDGDATAIGIKLIVNVVDVVMERLPGCEDDIYDFLARVSNLDVEAIKDLDIDVFVMMIMDFFKKEEFRDFFRAVSALMK